MRLSPTSVSFLATLTLLFTVTGCRYSNTFNGSFQDLSGVTPTSSTATLSAFSKNINKFCIDLTLEHDGQTFATAIHASEVFDQNDPLASKAFNTKGSDCNPNADTFISGQRNVKIVSSYSIYEQVACTPERCAQVVYPVYRYQESIQMNVVQSKDDKMVGKFEGSASDQNYIDHDHPISRTPCYLPCDHMHFPHNRF
jgi:hypothetical protein